MTDNREPAKLFAGLLFDFMGWLTTHETRWKFSAYDDASPGVYALEEFAKARSLSLDDPGITDWRAALTPPSAPGREGIEP